MFVCFFAHKSFYLNKRPGNCLQDYTEASLMRHCNSPRFIKSINFREIEHKLGITSKTLRVIVGAVFGNLGIE